MKDQHIEVGGKTLVGRQGREWYAGMRSNVNGRGCEIVRFKKGTTARVLVRWADTGLTRWVGLYDIEPEIY